ncbi:MAG: pirin family protein [Bdellovibrionota bacterium]
MIQVRKSDERGRTQISWLDGRHTFSFGGYYDPEWMGFSSLRVINEDRVAPGGGFPTHPHRDMEIVTYVLEGALEHKDSLGNGSIIRPGEVQRMSAGTGITHSEFNHSRSEPVHLLQIWFLPARAGIKPGYEQKTFSEEERKGRWRLVASPDGKDGSVTIHQDARLYAALLDGAGEEISFTPATGRRLWVQAARGAFELNGKTLVAGDGAAAVDEKEIRLQAKEPGEALLFDLD